MNARGRLLCLSLLAAAALLAACGRATPVPSQGGPLGPGEVALEVRNQPVRDGAVMIDRVQIDRDGWVAVQINVGGGPGEVLGQTQVASGVTQDVRVAIDVSRATANLIAVLYEDSGQIGVFEFPQADPPVLGSSGPAMAMFTVQLP